MVVVLLFRTCRGFLTPVIPGCLPHAALIQHDCHLPFSQASLPLARRRPLPSKATVVKAVEDERN